MRLPKWYGISTKQGRSGHETIEPYIELIKNTLMEWRSFKYPFFWGIKQCTSMVILKVFPCNSAFFLRSWKIEQWNPTTKRSPNWSLENHHPNLHDFGVQKWAPDPVVSKAPSFPNFPVTHVFISATFLWVKHVDGRNPANHLGLHKTL